MRVNLLSCFSSLFIRYYLSWFPDDVEDLFVNCKSFIRFPLVLAMGWFPSWWIMFWFDPGCGNSILINFCFYFILSFKCFTGLYNWKVDCSFDKKKKIVRGRGRELYLVLCILSSGLIWALESLTRLVTGPIWTMARSISPLEQFWHIYIDAAFIFLFIAHKILIYV